MFLCCLKYTEEKKGLSFHPFLISLFVGSPQKKDHGHSPIFLTSKHHYNLLNLMSSFLNVLSEIALTPLFRQLYRQRNISAPSSSGQLRMELMERQALNQSQEGHVGSMLDCTARYTGLSPQNPAATVMFLPCPTC